MSELTEKYWQATELNLCNDPFSLRADELFELAEKQGYEWNGKEWQQKPRYVSYSHYGPLFENT